MWLYYSPSILAPQEKARAIKMHFVGDHQATTSSSRGEGQSLLNCMSMQKPLAWWQKVCYRLVLVPLWKSFATIQSGNVDIHGPRRPFINLFQRSLLSSGR